MVKNTTVSRSTIRIGYNLREAQGENLRAPSKTLNDGPRKLLADAITLRTDSITLRTDPITLRTDAITLRTNSITLRTDAITLLTGPKTQKYGPGMPNSRAVKPLT